MRCGRNKEKHGADIENFQEYFGNIKYVIMYLKERNGVMRASEKRKNNILIGVLLGVVVIMGIAYAAFASNLNITGTSSMSENWCIGFDSTRTSDYQATAGIQGGTVPTGSMSFSGDSCGGNLKTTASLNASFKQPGDKVEYTLTIGNKGTLAAAIESIEVDGDSVTSDTTITKGNIKYIIEMPLSTSLAVNATTTMKVTAMFQNDTEVTSSTNEEQSISIGVNAVQDDGNGGFTPTPTSFTGTIYRWNTTTASNGNPIVPVSGTKWVIANGSGVQGPPDVYDTEVECQTGYAGYGSPAGYSCQEKTGTFGGVGEYTTDASTLNRTYYLKHDVVDDIITASYVCFVTDEEHCLKGGDGGESFASNTQIIQDYQTFYNLPSNNANPGCTFTSSGSSCSGGGFRLVSAHSDGAVSVNGSSSGYCYVSYDGYSTCSQE